MHTTTAAYTMVGNPQKHVSQLLRSQTRSKFSLLSKLSIVHRKNNMARNVRQSHYYSFILMRFLNRL